MLSKFHTPVLIKSLLRGSHLCDFSSMSFIHEREVRVNVCSYMVTHTYRHTELQTIVDADIVTTHGRTDRWTDGKTYINALRENINMQHVYACMYVSAYIQHLPQLFGEPGHLVSVMPEGSTCRAACHTTGRHTPAVPRYR